jgi:hypothetical protein
MKHVQFSRALALALAAALVPAAQAAAETFVFQYSSPSGVIVSGQLLGTLQPDDNTIVVSSMLGVPRLNGTPAVAVPFVDSIIDVAGGSHFWSPVVSLDGGTMDFAACTDAKCDDGFGFESSGVLGFPVAVTLGSFGNLGFETYSSSQWAISAVPESGTLMLMAIGLLGLGLRRRA